MAAFYGFKNACIEADKVEQEDDDGYNIDDFDNIHAYVTFTHESVK